MAQGLGLCFGEGHGRLGGGGESASPPNEFVDVGDEYAAWHRFDQVVIGAGIQRAGDHAGIVKGREDDDGNVAEGANGFTNFPAVHSRHHQVEQYQAGRFFANELNPFFAAIGREHLEAVRAEKNGEEFGDCGIVVNR